jgi:hypothetical protein
MLFSIGLAILTYFHKFDRASLGSNINGLMKVFVGVEEERDFVETRLHTAFGRVRDVATRLYKGHATQGPQGYYDSFFTGMNGDQSRSL